MNPPGYRGRIGKVIAVSPPHLKLKMEDLWEILVVEQANVESVVNNQPAARQVLPGKPAAGATSAPLATSPMLATRLKVFWSGLSDMGRAWIVIGACVAMAVVVVTIWVSATGGLNGSHSSIAGYDAGRGSSPPPSTTDDWLAAVCKPGTFANGGQLLRNADGKATCMAHNQYPILVGQYSSQFNLTNDVALYRGAAYATLEMDSGMTQVFVMPSGGNQAAAALAPLERFGFQMHSVPR